MLRPEEAKSLFERRSATVGTPAMAELDREMTPILAEVMAVGRFLILEDNEDPAATKLFDWLLDSKRTGEEFTYVIGPLRRTQQDMGRVSARTLLEICDI